MEAIKRELIYKIFTHMPVIETERLLLRKMRADDAPDMYEYACRRDVTEFLTWCPHVDESYTRDYLEYIESYFPGRILAHLTQFSTLLNALVTQSNVNF